MAKQPDDRRLELLQSTLDMLIFRLNAFVAAAVLIGAAASLVPATRASRIDVMQALRSE